MFNRGRISENERSELLEKLSRSYFFSDFTEDELTLLIECAQDIDFDPGDTIFKEGDIGVYFYVIYSGEVEIRKEKSGKCLAALGPGKVFGEMAVLDNQPRSANAISVTSTELIAVEGHKLLEEYPHLTVKLLRNLARELSSKVRETNFLLDRY